MSTRPNFVLLGLVASVGLAALGAVVLAAEAHGKRRQLKRAYLMDRSKS